jgi:NDP-sugar pyrophosphorylase family protein
MAHFEPSAKITNNAIHDFPGNKVCVIMMGEDATADNTWRVIFKEEFDMDLPAGETFEWSGTPFKQMFDRTLSMGGYDYDGYIVMIRNSEGKIAVTAATKTYWLADPEKAWQMVKDKDYDRKFFRK